MNTDELVTALRSGDLKRQDSAFKEITALTVKLAEESVRALSASASPVVVAENIFQLGQVVRPPLEELFHESPSQELKAISASLLVQLGSRVGIDFLLHTIRSDSEHDTLAAMSLAKAGLRDAVPALIEKLENFNHKFYSKRENAPKINTFLVALKQLGGNLPSSLKERFTASDVPADLSGFIE